MGTEAPWIAVVLWIMRILVFVYDVITLPIYFVIQKPWLQWRKNSVTFGRLLKEGDPSSPCVRVPLPPKNKEPIPTCETIDQLFDYALQKYPDRPILATREVLGEETETQSDGKVFKKLTLGEYKWLTFREVGKKVDNFSRGLLNLGIKPRQRIAIFAETRLEWMLAAQACFRINIPVVTVYDTLGEEGILHSLNDTGVTHLITSKDLLHKVEKISSKMLTVKCIIYMEGLTPPKYHFNDSIQVLPFQDVEKLGETKIPDISGERPEAEDTIIIMYTSGSTGVPKGVVLTHKNVLTVLKGIYMMCPEILPTDLHIGYLPLAHITELTAECCFMSAGIPIGYSSPHTLTEKSTAVKRGDRGDINVLRPSGLLSVPLVLEKIYKGVMDAVTERGQFAKAFFLCFLKYKKFWMKRGFRTPILSWLMFRKVKAGLGGRIRFILSGGAPLASETQEFIQAALDCPVFTGYGLTEVSAGACLMDPDEVFSGGIGAPVPGCYIKLVDWEEGGYHITDKPNPRGEIVIGGNTVSSGYFKNDQLTRECFKEEDGTSWHFSGDIGELAPNGTFRIIDRKKDLLKLKHGEYVSLGSVELELKTSMLVENVCVYGNGLKSYLVALMMPNPNQLRTLAKSMGKDGLCWKEMCDDPTIESEVLNIIVDHCKNRKLLKCETPAKLKLCAEEWLPDTGLLTSGFKVKRKQIEDFYQKDIDKMYAT